ncbi:hypothetical protein [Sphingomonas colocasiae]|uniref:DUF3313 domain-containing protein n=1 Tax=Sphingomonas colocasiae TaxID=1848973 RepID=A0ABS7PNG1_9SPHN|nr:hypothetical protein [Sphingomonas colocasiae]MBY8822850.1 hypothetical protein [Sphingomonas colocasiae]
MSRPVITTLLSALALAAMPASALAAKAKDPVKVTSAKNVKGTQRVVIGQLTIGFLIERKDSTKAGGGMLGSGYGGRSTVRSTLAGYTQADLQQIADAAHDDLAARLTAAGFEVVDRAALAAHPAYAKAKGEPGTKEMTTITGRDDKANVLFVSAAQTAPLKLVTGDVAASGFGAMGLIMNGTQVMNGATTYAKETGVNVVNAIYYVDFADSDEYGGWFRSTSAVSVKGSLALLPDQSKLTVVGPNYKSATLALADPVAVGGDFFDKADSMSGGEKTANAIGNAIGLLGGVGTNSSKKFTFTARPGTYVPGAKQAAFDANEVLVGRLASLR